MPLGIFFSLLITSVILIYYVNGGKHNLGRAVNKFSDDLYRELRKEEGNIVFSPFSVHTVLGLLTLGAKGNTQKELLSKLHLKNINYVNSNLRYKSGKLSFTVTNRNVYGRGDEGAESGILRRVTVRVYRTYVVMRFISYCRH